MQSIYSLGFSCHSPLKEVYFSHGLHVIDERTNDVPGTYSRQLFISTLLLVLFFELPSPVLPLATFLPLYITASHTTPFYLYPLARHFVHVRL